MVLVIKGLIIWRSKRPKNPQVVYDGYVKYEEAEIHISAIMKDFRISEKKKLKWQTGGHQIRIDGGEAFLENCGLTTDDRQHTMA